jgi:ATP-dependent RNA helicase RhlE
MNNFKRSAKPAGQVRSPRPQGRPAQKRKESTLDPNLLVKKAQPSGQEGFQSVTPFTGLQLNSLLLKNIHAKGYENMTYIQEK